MNIVKFFDYPTLFPTTQLEYFNNLIEDAILRDKHLFNQNRGLTLTDFPRGEVYTYEGKLYIELALAGFSKEQLSISVEDGNLIVAASKCENETDTPRCLARRAFKKTFCDFARQWDVDKAEATFKDGLLRICLPPVEQTVLVKKIDIK